MQDGRLYIMGEYFYPFFAFYFLSQGTNAVWGFNFLREGVLKPFKLLKCILAGGKKGKLFCNFSFVGSFCVNCKCACLCAIACYKLRKPCFILSGGCRKRTKGSCNFTDARRNFTRARRKLTKGRYNFTRAYYKHTGGRYNFADARYNFTGARNIFYIESYNFTGAYSIKQVGKMTEKLPLNVLYNI